MLKRAFDILLSASTLVIFLPIEIIIAILIFIEDRQSVIFKQKRIGLNQRPFTLYKFRSMKGKKGSFNGSFDIGDQSRFGHRIGLRGEKTVEAGGESVFHEPRDLGWLGSPARAPKQMAGGVFVPSGGGEGLPRFLRGKVQLHRKDWGS